jgi:hypothetical protein
LRGEAADAKIGYSTLARAKCFPVSALKHPTVMVHSLNGMKRYWFVVLVLFVTVLPQQASANAGTPLMWAGMFHLLIGNALIGLIEGVLLARFFKVSRTKAVVSMIAANYLSAWLGGLFLRGAIISALPMDITNAWRWFWIMAVLTYGITLVLEWPFIATRFRGSHDWFKRSLRASLLVQTASYVLLFGAYWLVSHLTIYTKMHIVAFNEIEVPPAVAAYYIAAKDGNVYKRYPGDNKEQKVYDLGSRDPNDRLFVTNSISDAGGWELIARIETGDHRNPKLVRVLSNLSLLAAPETQGMRGKLEGTRFSFGQVPTLGTASNSAWEFRAGFWEAEGLGFRRRDSAAWAAFAYETPFGAWAVRNAVHLPGDKVLFQFGDDQICAFDPATRRVALLCRGRGPVAVIENVEVNLTARQPLGETRLAVAEDAMLPPFYDGDNTAEYYGRCPRCKSWIRGYHATHSRMPLSGRCERCRFFLGANDPPSSQPRIVEWLVVE